MSQDKKNLDQIFEDSALPDQDEDEEEEPRVFGRFEVLSLESACEENDETQNSKLATTRPRNVSALPICKEHSSSPSRTSFSDETLPDEISFNDIKWGSIIGRGAFGEVFKGELYGQEIAIKKLIMKNSKKGHLRRFLREVEIMRSLRHPNIVEFMGVCVQPTNVCIITEYMRKGSLHSILRKRTSRWPWKRYLRLAQDVARGLNWLHSRGIIHRDLKPSNLLVSRNNCVKIADFGLSHVKRSPATQEGTYGVCGTPCYMAPEVLRKLPYSFRADVFSLGMVLCEMISGRYPLRDLDLRSTEPNLNLNLNSIDFENAIISGIRPQVPADVPLGLAKLIRRCWEQEPFNRPSVLEVLEELSHIELEIEQALQEALDEAIDDIPEQVQVILREQQKRTTELRDALSDTHSQIDGIYKAIEEKERVLQATKKKKEDLEKRKSELAERKKTADSEFKSLSNQLREWRLALYHKEQDEQKQKDGQSNS